MKFFDKVQAGLSLLETWYAGIEYVEFRTYIAKHGPVFELLQFMLKAGEEYILTYIHYRKLNSGLHESPKSKYLYLEFGDKHVF
jgi:hypothetical protein